MFKALLASAILLSAAIASAKPSDLKLCETYRGVNASLNCSQANYLMQFGYKYCVRYVLLEQRYQPATQLVLEKIRSCLVAEVLNDQQLNCSNSEQRAMKHHLKCYHQAGFCGLPILEKLKIFGVASSEMAHESFRQTMIAATKQCGFFE